MPQTTLDKTDWPARMASYLFGIDASSPPPQRVTRGEHEVLLRPSTARGRPTPPQFAPYPQLMLDPLASNRGQITGVFSLTPWDAPDKLMVRYRMPVSGAEDGQLHTSPPMFDAFLMMDQRGQTYHCTSEPPQDLRGRALADIPWEQVVPSSFRTGPPTGEGRLSPRTFENRCTSHPLSFTTPPTDPHKPPPAPSRQEWQTRVLRAIATAAAANAARAQAHLSDVIAAISRSATRCASATSQRSRGSRSSPNPTA